MKNLNLFYLKSCPYCKKAISYLDELLKESKYSAIKLTKIEEREQSDISGKFDYWYVPCFYLGSDKLSEGEIDRAGVEKILKLCLDKNA